MWSMCECLCVGTILILKGREEQSMGYMTINNRRVAFTDEKNVLSMIRKSGIDLPTFCYHSELSTYGACRMCVVEDERGKVFASCSEVPRDGMVIYTNTPRLQHHRKMIIELLLSSRCRRLYNVCQKWSLYVTEAGKPVGYFRDQI